MRKADLVSRIAEKTGVAKVDVLMTLENFFTEVKESLSSKENVYIRGFGSFVAKKRAKKIGRNIKQNKAIVIPAHYIPAFKPAKSFISKVKEEAEKKGDKKVADKKVVEKKATDKKATDKKVADKKAKK